MNFFCRNPGAISMDPVFTESSGVGIGLGIGLGIGVEGDSEVASFGSSEDPFGGRCPLPRSSSLQEDRKIVRPHKATPMLRE